MIRKHLGPSMEPYLDRLHQIGETVNPADPVEDAFRRAYNMAANMISPLPVTKGFALDICREINKRHPQAYPPKGPRDANAAARRLLVRMESYGVCHHQHGMTLLGKHPSPHHAIQKGSVTRFTFKGQAIEATVVAINRVTIDAKDRASGIVYRVPLELIEATP